MHSKEATQDPTGIVRSNLQAVTTLLDEFEQTLPGTRRRAIAHEIRVALTLQSQLEKKCATRPLHARR